MDLLLEALFKLYGYDFRQYARASITRRVKDYFAHTNLKSISELLPRVMNDAEFSSELILSFSVSVTEMFRDPMVYKQLREKIIPVLRTWPFIKVWHAGCSTGEEVYSLAIVFREEGLYKHTTFYATDFNDNVLQKAKQGIYRTEQIRLAVKNYIESGGTGALSDYYHANYQAVMLDPSLKERITCANHNLVADQTFGEFQLIFCRNVLIYFDREFQNRVIRLMTESLVHGGFLCLGTKETLEFSEESHHYDTIDKKNRIYQKKR